MVFERGSANGLNFTMFIRRNLYKLLYRVIYEHRYLHYNNQGSQKQLYTYDARRTIVLVISPFPLKDRTYVCVDVK